jgi:type II secretory pathway pseudopilin PulG
MTRPAASQRQDAGETLIEILLTVVVLAITVTGLIGALTVAIVGTDSHRRLSDVEVVTRAYGEQVVDQANHQPTTTLAADTDAGATSISVTSSAGFPAAPFTALPITIAVDGEVTKLTKIVGTTWTVAALQDAHTAGSSVQQYLFYDAVNGQCPTGTQFQLSAFSVPATVASVGKINVPTVTATAEYFDAAGQPITSASCSSYWSTSGQPCKLFDPATQPHETQCDVELIRLTISTSTTITGTQRSASTTTRVLVRRGNA